jgi:precorrin-6Y C5,15-methyltransferase (decarboxylating)
MVANVASLESLTATYTTLKAIVGGVQVLLVNVARGTEQLETLRFEAINPSFLLRVVKPMGSSSDDRREPLEGV